MTIIDRPLIAITVGDATGIGPEVGVKALLAEEIYAICRPLGIGEKGVMERTLALVKQPLRLNVVNTATGVRGEHGIIDLLDMHNLKESEVTVGKVCAVCGKASVDFILKAMELALKGEAKAIVTAPINKEATTLAGCGDLGHLELLAHHTGTKEYATMLVSGTLRVVHLTTHHSLRDACDLVTKERVLARLKLTDRCFKEWGIAKPRIAVAALNPHGGENGLFGREEMEQITPAVKDAQGIGINALGPYPADSIFNRALNGDCDVVLALYHDQGHIPVKVHGVEQSVSIALGLPFIRTSVDHGTAFDIAGKGIADAQSMVEAIKVAVKLNQKNLL